ncbi:unnamed protein product [Caretta caretta]
MLSTGNKKQVMGYQGKVEKRQKPSQKREERKLVIEVLGDGERKEEQGKKPGRNDQQGKKYLEMDRTRREESMAERNHKEWKGQRLRRKRQRPE